MRVRCRASSCTLLPHSSDRELVVAAPSVTLWRAYHPVVGGSSQGAANPAAENDGHEPHPVAHCELTCCASVAARTTTHHQWSAVSSAATWLRSCVPWAAAAAAAAFLVFLCLLVAPAAFEGTGAQQRRHRPRRSRIRARLLLSTSSSSNTRLCPSVGKGTPLRRSLREARGRRR